jgi:hydroxymethylglutaryl-CoA reductase (NADPH)
MNLRNLPENLDAAERCDARRKTIEQEVDADLSALTIHPLTLGHAEEKNCEQMFGHVPIPVGYAGPLRLIYSTGENTTVHLPLATTEGALVASVNRGCKALAETQGVRTSSVQHGTTRSLAFKIKNSQYEAEKLAQLIKEKESEWKKVGEATSDHLSLISSEIDIHEGHIFLTIAYDTDEAMGMNMVTIAAQAIGTWLVEHCEGLQFITVAGNVDSDKKPSTRTHEKGRGYEATAETLLTPDILKDILKVTPETLLAVAQAKLTAGSFVAGALGKNLHAANIVAALYLATGQDIAHTVEGSLTDTTVKSTPEGISISVRLPAILVGIRGGGTTLPAQKQCLSLLLKPKTVLHPCQQLAETIAAAVLAGEISLLAAQASHTLAKSHEKVGR